MRYAPLSVLSAACVAGSISALASPPILSLSGGRSLPLGQGVVVGSLVSAPNAHIYDHKLAYRSLSGRRVKGWITRSHLDRMTVQDQGNMGIAFILDLPAGDYEFYNCHLSARVGVAEVTARADNDFSIPFRVDPGRIVYLGEFRLTGITGKTKRGYPIPAGGYYEVSDQITRDLGILRSKNPSLDWRQTATRVIRPPASAAPLFR